MAPKVPCTWSRIFWSRRRHILYFSEGHISRTAGPILLNQISKWPLGPSASDHGARRAHPAPAGGPPGPDEKKNIFWFFLKVVLGVVIWAAGASWGLHFFQEMRVTSCYTKIIRNRKSWRKFSLKNQQSCAAGTPPISKQDSEGISPLRPRGRGGGFSPPLNSARKIRLFLTPDSDSAWKNEHFPLSMSSADPPPSTLKSGLKNQNFTQKFLQIPLLTEKNQTSCFPVYQGVLHPKINWRPIRGHIRGLKISVVWKTSFFAFFGRFSTTMDGAKSKFRKKAF
jgi:hypothetical protein